MTEGKITPRPYTLDKAPKYNERDGYGILNTGGDFWSTELFVTPRAALDYVQTYLRQSWPKEADRLALNYMVVPVKQTLTLLPKSQTYHVEVYRVDREIGEKTA
jgi:hypothetical protein